MFLANRVIFFEYGVAGAFTCELASPLKSAIIAGSYLFTGLSLDSELVKHGLVKSSMYLYTEDLLALDSHRPTRAISTQTFQPQSYSPLVWEKWAQSLKNHPDRRFVEYLLKGIKQGFRIGFNRTQRLQNATSNLPNQAPSVISEYLARGVSFNRMVKLPVGVWPSGTHTSLVGTIPKKNKLGKWRLIVDLSSPSDHSINDGICPERSSLLYTSVDNLAAMILSEGQGSFRRIQYILTEPSPLACVRHQRFSLQSKMQSSGS